MGRRLYIFFLAMLALLAAGFAARGQEVVDRIVARVENDIILQSDIGELSRYQLFANGKSETDEQILNRLIDQWIVRNEANVALFPQPSKEDVARSLARLQRSFSSPEEFEERKKHSGLSDDDILRMLKSQLYLSNYLDTRFRPAIQIDDKAIEEFYKSRVVPRAEARGQTPPSLDTARDFIQEALVQRAIDEEADKWLKESRGRLHVQNFLNENPQ
jgi:parvulin-like peptidyl-prolyl isomerase